MSKSLDNPHCSNRTSFRVCVVCLAVFGLPVQGQEHSVAGSAQDQATTRTDQLQPQDGSASAQKSEQKKDSEAVEKKAADSQEVKTKPGSADSNKIKPKPGESTDSANQPKVAAPRITRLLSGDFAKTWKLFAAEKDVKLDQVWKVVDQPETGRILICTGKPKGYLRTRTSYGNYKLSFEFRYPMDKNGNSGVLLHIDGKDKIWPDGVQVQLHGPRAGSIFPVGNRKTRFTIGAKLPLLNKWNKCEIDVLNDTIEVRINKVAVGPLRFCDPAKGFIALQAEGSQVQFRKMVLVQPNAPAEPPATPKKPPTVAKEGESKKPAADDSAVTVPPKKNTEADGGDKASSGVSQ